MNSIEFGMACRPYNLKYRDLFGSVPCPDDYACNREEFFQALKSAVEEKRPLDEILQKAAPQNPGRIY